MYRSVVVPLDGSPFAERAVPLAARLCPAGGRLVLARSVFEVMVVTNPSAARIAVARKEAAIAEAEAYLAEMAEKTRSQGVQVVTRVEQRDPPGVILGAVAEEPDSSLVVMATHSRSASFRAVLGSVADEVVRRSPVPVLLLPPAYDAAWTATLLQVLVPLDGSAIAERALAPAVEISQTLGASVSLLHVIDPEARFEAQTADQYLNDRAASLQGKVNSITTSVVAGKPAERILKAVEEQPAHVIAMATHGRSGIARALLGSVTTAVMAAAKVPVLVVGPTAPNLLL
jgi:nucleotide-binding universal stress UspA family protein